MYIVTSKGEYKNVQLVCGVYVAIGSILLPFQNITHALNVAQFNSDAVVTLEKEFTAVPSMKFSYKGKTIKCSAA